MTRYRPVPRTLSEIFRRLAPRGGNAPKLMPPEELKKVRAPMVNPEQLFKGVTVRASVPDQTLEAIAREGIKPPEQLFQDQRLAQPGQSLASPQELDFLPSQGHPEIILSPLPPEESTE